MMNQRPNSLFGFMPPTYAPMEDVSGGGPAAMPAPAFVNGAGGQRIAPDVLAMRQKLAQQQMAAGSDTSPVGHWTQGLARVAQALAGSMEMGRLDKAASANSAAEQQILRSLVGGGGGDPAMLAAMSDPNISDGAKEALKLQWTATHRAPTQPSEFERTLTAAGVQTGTPEWVAANKSRLQNYTDPTVTVPLPGGRVYVGPRSGIAAATGGGDPSISGQPGVSPPAQLPADFDFDAGGPTQPASGGFR